MASFGGAPGGAPSAALIARARAAGAEAERAVAAGRSEFALASFKRILGVLVAHLKSNDGAGAAAVRGLAAQYMNRAEELKILVAARPRGVEGAFQLVLAGLSPLVDAAMTAGVGPRWRAAQQQGGGGGGGGGTGGGGRRGRGVCFDFQRGRCTRGDACRYRHARADEEHDDSTASTTTGGAGGGAGGGGAAPAPLDLAALLRVLWANWRRLRWQGGAGPAPGTEGYARSLVGELRHWRNEWAHQRLARSRKCDSGFYEEGCKPPSMVL